MVEREAAALPLRYPALDTRQPSDNPMLATRLRENSVDAVERGHDISFAVDPGYCSGARYERTIKYRSRHYAF